MKIFACSDLHSYWKPFKETLDKKGFEANNPNHLLVICGDTLDRGYESCEIYEFLNNLTNVVLVKGNHEDLMEKVWLRGYCAMHDISNGTQRSINGIFYKYTDFVGNPDPVRVSEEILKPFFDKMVNYFETKNYIFVHGWIPCDTQVMTHPWYQNNRPLQYNPDWRNASDEAWEAARWINGIDAGFVKKKKVLEPGKTIVCGHWHCSYGHYWKAVKDTIAAGDTIFETKASEFGDDACFEPFEADGILAIDACTIHTGKVNVVVLEDDLLDETAT
jgi:predicted phosphodiesterase